MSFLFLVLAVTGYLPWVSAGPEGGEVKSPVQSVSNPDELWALSGTNPTQVIHSQDAGLSWSTLASFSGSTPYDMIICPDGRLVAGGSSRTWTSSDGGVTWTSHSHSNKIFYDLTSHPTDPGQVFAAGYAYDGGWKMAFMHSTDGGNSFTVTNPTLPGSFTYSYGRCIAVGASDPSVILLGGYGYSTTDATYTPLLLKSSDGGVTFADVTPPGASSQYYFYGAGIHPSNPDILLGGSLYSMYRSTDGGTTWTTAAASQTYSYQVTFSEADPDLVFAGGSNRLYRSTDAGQSWSSVTSGLGGSGIQQVLPDWSNASNVFTGSSSGFYLSTSGGTSWTGSNSGLLVGKVLAMEESQGWYFMNMEDMGLYRAPSGFPVSWEEVSTPLSCGDFCDICADGAGVLLALEGTG